MATCPFSVAYKMVFCLLNVNMNIYIFWIKIDMLSKNLVKYCILLNVFSIVLLFIVDIFTNIFTIFKNQINLFKSNQNVYQCTHILTPSSLTALTHIWPPCPYLSTLVYSSPPSRDPEEDLPSQNGPRELPQDGLTDDGATPDPAPALALGRSSSSSTTRVPKKLSFVLENERDKE